MNKAQLIEHLSLKTRLPKSQSEEVLNATLEIIEAAVCQGEEVKLVGFGTFDQSLRKARMGRNPKTGSSLMIPECRVPRFRPGKDFKERLESRSKK